MSKVKCCIFPATLLGILVFLIVYYIWAGIQRNNTLIYGNNDVKLATELNNRLGPIVESINQYYSNNGEYPKNIDELIPKYIQEKPSGFLGGQLIYDPESYYGIPFFLAYRGNYFGPYFMHGWALIYCPLLKCEISGPPSRRIDKVWIFLNSSAL